MSCLGFLGVWFCKLGYVYTAGRQDCQGPPFSTQWLNGVSYIVVVFLGDYRSRIWCHIPTGIKTLPSDDFPKPLCFEAEC